LFVVGMALVEHYEKIAGRWYVQLVAIWHWYLPFCISVCYFGTVFVHSFLLLLLLLAYLI